MKKYAVIGKNINYSLSPKLHQANFKSLHLDDVTYDIYNCLDITKEIVNLRQFSGFNMTVPFKEDIMSFCEEVMEEAKEVKAVNCVKVINHLFYGYNTDIYGFYKLLESNDLLNQSKKSLVIGAGGAAKAVYYCLKNLCQMDVVVTNRTMEKARAITVNTLDFEEISDHLSNFDLVVNCTSSQDPIKIREVKTGAAFIDINYHNHSNFLKGAKTYGATTIDGTLMLVYQAAKSFEIWFDQEANVDIMKESIRKDE